MVKAAVITPSKKGSTVAKIAAAPAIIKPRAAKLLTPATEGFSSAMAAYYAGQLDEIDKKLRIRAGAERSTDPVSTGLLCADWVMGGGVRSVFNQVSGFEQAGKTTLTVGVLGGAVRVKTPLIEYIDAEGSLTPDYADAVLGSFGLSDVFDQRFRRYYSLNVLEETTSQIARFVRRMPDKLYLEEIGSWAYVIPKGLPKWTACIDALKSAGIKEDKTAGIEGYWVFPTDYSGPEAALFVDSWPALLPEAIDEIIDKEKDSGAGLGIVARVLAEELRTFAGRLKRKGVLFWSVNQLREKPMAQGNPEYEPGGNALKLYSMVRNQMRVIMPPPGWDRDPEVGSLCIEESAYGNGYDRYAFKSFKNTKNKLGRPFLKTMARVWTSDEGGNAQGFDPVFDVWNYLKSTEQVSGGRNKAFALQLKDSVKGPATQMNSLQMKWWHFKAIILAEHFRDKELLKPVAEELGLAKAPNLRATLFKQVREDKTLWGEQFASDDAEADAEAE